MGETAATVSAASTFHRIGPSLLLALITIRFGHCSSRRVQVFALAVFKIIAQHILWHCTERVFPGFWVVLKRGSQARTNKAGRLGDRPFPDLQPSALAKPRNSTDRVWVSRRSRNHRHQITDLNLRRSPLSLVAKAMMPAASRSLKRNGDQIQIEFGPRH